MGTSFTSTGTKTHHDGIFGSWEIAIFPGSLSTLLMDFCLEIFWRWGRTSMGEISTDRNCPAAGCFLLCMPLKLVSACNSVCIFTQQRPIKTDSRQRKIFLFILFPTCFYTNTTEKKVGGGYVLFVAGEFLSANIK